MLTNPVVGWQIFGLAVLAALFGGKLAWKRVHPAAGLALFWAIISAARVFACPLSPFRDQPAGWVLSFDYSAAESLATLAMTLLAAYCLPLRIWFGLIRIAALINAVWIFCDPVNAWGIFNNASMSGCFAACCIPFYLMGSKRSKRFPKLAAIAAISAAVTRRSQPLLLLGALAALYLLRKRRFKTLAAIVAASIPLAWFGGLFHLTNRDEIWRWTGSWWLEHANLAFGAGSGSFYILGPYLTNRWGELIAFMHSDWMQLTFEQGVIGFTCGVLLLFAALAASRKQFACLCAVSVYALWAVANMPVRYPTSALLGAIVLRWAFSDSKPTTFREILGSLRSFLAARRRSARSPSRSC